MSLNILVIAIILLFLLGKILNLLVKKSDEKKLKSERQRKLKIPTLNTLGLYSRKDFKDLSIRYLKVNKYDIEESKEDANYSDEYILASSNEGDRVIIQLEHFDSFMDKVNKESIYMLVSRLEEEGRTYGIIISNGGIGMDANDLIRQDLNGFDIDIIDGAKLVKEIRMLKSEEFIRR